MATLLLVHAHPDDEAISTGGVMLRAHEAGHRVVLVTATRGEEGEIHNMDEAEVRPRLGDVRTEELRRAAEILCVDRQEFLGYRDSGMAGTPSNEDPRSFHRAPLAEAAERLAVLMREERAGRGGHVHAGRHVRAPRPHQGEPHERSPRSTSWSGRGWQPDEALPAGDPARADGPVRRARQGDGRRDARGCDPDRRHPGRGDHHGRGLSRTRWTGSGAAFAAHLSQNDPNSPFQSMADQILVAVFGTERFVLARGTLGEPHPEHDLFVGV